MIIEASHKIETNIQNSHQFSVSENSSKLFAMLSDSLYTQKERSVITELSSNAFDAHILVGKKHIPFEVQLPTNLVPELRIRDFGPGLSEDNVYNFLTKFGSSSKENSNDFVGAFGIGSKSPASVTDSWEIKSYNGGKLSHYLVHINENGIPSINKILEKDSDETGLEVIVPTKSNAQTIWHQAARQTYLHYDTVPVVKGIASPIVQFTPSIKCKTFHADSNTQSCGILINQRMYALDTSMFNQDTKHNYIMHSKPMLPFNIGELSISLSREALQYNARTKSAISKRLDDVFDELKDLWKDEVSPAKNIMEYQLACSGFIKKYNIVAALARELAFANTDSYSVNMGNLNRFTITPPAAIKDIETYVFDGKYRKGGVDVSYDRMYITFNYHADVLFVCKDIRNTKERVRQQSLESGKVYRVLSEEIFNLIPDCFKKIKASELDFVKIKRERTITKKIESDIYIKSGKRFCKIDPSRIDKTKKIVCVTFKSANSTATANEDVSSSIFSVGCQVIGVKETDKIPSYAITPTQYAQSVYDRMLANKKELILSYRKNSMPNTTIAYLLNVSLATNRTVHNSIFNEYADSVQEVREFRPSIGMISHTAFIEAAEYLGIKDSDKDFDKLDFGVILTTYPMLKFISYVYDEQSKNDIFEYINGIGK